MMASVIHINDARIGATPDEWAHFDLLLGLTADLLPVVSNTGAAISPDSKMKDIGKTPSVYNRDRKVVGLSEWTKRIATPEDVAKWAKERDYGICLQTRIVRAIDVDIPDPEVSQRVRDFIAARLKLPARSRDNSAKFLVAFALPGNYTKRKFKTEGGIVEFLATGQQFVALGRHPSGVRYEWDDGLPTVMPMVSDDEFEALWAALIAEFAVEAPSEASVSVKADKLHNAIHSDPVAQHLLEQGWVKSDERDGRLHIRCPFEAEHTSESSDSATTYWPAHTGGFVQGHFDCKHAHCEARSDDEFKAGIGFAETDDFDVLADQDAPALAEDPTPPDPAPPADDKPRNRFAAERAADFANAKPMHWIIKRVLPKAELVVVFGESGSGKSFFVLDMAAAVAQGVPWCGRKVRQGRVVYVAAEGAGGVRNRLRAYAEHHGIDLAALDIWVIAAAPNLLQKADAIDVAKSVLAIGGVSLVIVDTFAQATAGGNENSGEDVGKAISHCKGIHRATGAVVMLIHHSGKDATKGARGWSGLRAAVDAEIEIVRADNDRTATVSKQKDGEDGEAFSFRLSSVVLGIDEDDDEITSCIVEHQAQLATPRKKEPKGNIQRVVLRVFGDMADLDESVSVGSLIENSIAQLIHNPAEGRRDTRRQRVMDAVQALVSGNYLAINRGLVTQA